jgi:hypothetical protein
MNKIKKVVELHGEMSVEVVEEKVSGMQAMVDATVVNDDESLSNVSDSIKNIKMLKAYIVGEKEKFTKPAQAIINEARAKYLPFERECDSAETQLKSKAGAYMDKVEKERLAKEEKIAKRVEKGTLKEETAVRKMGEIGTVKKTVATASSQIQRKMVKVVTLTEIKELKDAEIINLARGGYLVWDTVKVNKVVKAGVDVVGAKVEEKSQIAVR